MSLIIVTGSNIGNSIQNLNQAKLQLNTYFNFISESRIYKSPPVDYLDQPDFYNQALEFKLPDIDPLEALTICQRVEKSLGRHKKIDKGPRSIDIDIIFWGNKSFNQKNLTIPHPAWSQRSFVSLPIKELPAYQLLRNYFSFPEDFDNIATPI